VAQIEEQAPRNPDKPRNDAAKRAPVCTLVIFGASGDLTKRLLMPALYNLAQMGLLDDGMKIIGVDHAESSDDTWRKSLGETMQSFTKDKTAEFYTDKIDEGAWGWVTSRLSYLQGDFEKPETFAEIGKRVGDGNCIFYLAVAAKFFGPVVEGLGRAKLVGESEHAFRRVVIEKPFGQDLASAEALDRQVLGVLREDQVFRIDYSWARRWSRTSWRCASPTGCSSRCGGANISTMCRSWRPRRSGWRVAAGFTKPPGRCATWCRTISSPCWR